ncbi:hypothetical protein P1S61_38835 [Streptomyces sp. ME08-AFT2]|uniref:hypothetical protein n=1 Tax=Streptomyces sp. ME08-AFT2 TaxID=3028683 RepID=UPI0029B3FF5F|nr:hypothetical protein [Streptomyces sp. ME08-AFT2]MDX3314914.1 hypothetical protein [Streptomyces sp. ME08-AFT2]
MGAEGEEQLDGFPEPWDPPAEVKGPTAVWMHNLVISMISSEIIGNDLMRLLGGVVSEHAGFNLWVLEEGKRILEVEELLDRSSALEEVVHKVYDAWRVYRDQFESAGRMVGSASRERQLLFEVLQKATADLVELRRVS